MTQAYNLSQLANKVNTSGQIDVSTALNGTVPTANGGTGSSSTTYCNLTSNVTGTLPVANGGTGQTTYTNGQLLIGNTTGNTLTKATLTAGTGITITNSTGSITIASSGAVSTDNGSAAIGTFVVGASADGTSLSSGSTTSSFRVVAPNNFGGTNGWKTLSGTWRNVSGSTIGYDSISDSVTVNTCQRIS